MRTLLIVAAIGLGGCATAGDADGTDARLVDAGVPDAAEGTPDDADDGDVADAGAADAEVPDAAPGAPDANVDAAAGTPVLELGAGTDTVQRGQQNGTPFDDVCPAGQALIGFAGALDAVGGAHGQIAGRCGTLSVAPAGAGFEVRVATGASLPTRGANDDAPWTRPCAANQVVVGFAGRSGALLDQLTFRCAPLTITASGASWTVAVAAATDLAPIGGSRGTAFAQTDCAAGQIAAVARIRAGDSVDAFGLGCRTPTAR